jgi:GTPase
MKLQLPIVAIIGRPNVGKSTLFNRLIGRRHAIVEDTPGVTRDRQYADVDWFGTSISLVDTGGFAPGEDDDFVGPVRRQAEQAIAEADAIIWLCNAREDITTAEEAIAHVVRRVDVPIFLAANKCDVVGIDVHAMAFYSLGVETVRAVSAEHGRGVSDLMDDVILSLSDAGKLVSTKDYQTSCTDPDAEALSAERGGHVSQIRFSIVGRPNVGKSTLANALLGDDRMLASKIPGTTRDSIDAELFWDDRPFTLIDTAGMRRPARVNETIEQYAVSRAVRSIERSHVAVLVLDATQELADQDARIANLIERRRRSAVVVVNKWDAVEKDHMTMKAYEEDLARILPFLADTPRVFISALDGKRLNKVMPAVQQAYDAFNTTIGTSRLNRWLERATLEKSPPMHRGKRIKLYFVAQTQTRPPRFEFQTNIEKPPPQHYQRFLKGRLRREFKLYGTPILIGYKRKAARRAGPRKRDADIQAADETGSDIDGGGQA